MNLAWLVAGVVVFAVRFVADKSAQHACNRGSASRIETLDTDGIRTLNSC